MTLCLKPINRDIILGNKNIFLFFLCAAYSVPSFSESQDNKFGIGFGAIYNGVGISYRTKYEKIYNYYSVGCPRAGYGQSSGFMTNCGIGYSLLVADISKENNHGVVGSVGVNYVNSIAASGVAYTVGINYVYFFDGVDGSGWNIQTGPIYEYFKGRYDLAGIIGFGYQY